MDINTRILTSQGPFQKVKQHCQIVKWESTAISNHLLLKLTLGTDKIF